MITGFISGMGKADSTSSGGSDILEDEIDGLERNWWYWCCVSAEEGRWWIESRTKIRMGCHLHKHDVILFISKEESHRIQRTLQH